MSHRAAGLPAALEPKAELRHRGISDAGCRSGEEERSGYVEDHKLFFNQRLPIPSHSEALSQRHQGQSFLIPTGLFKAPESTGSSSPVLVAGQPQVEKAFDRSALHDCCTTATFISHSSSHTTLLSTSFRSTTSTAASVSTGKGMRGSSGSHFSSTSTLLQTPGESRSPSQSPARTSPARSVTSPGRNSNKIFDWSLSQSEDLLSKHECNHFKGTRMRTGSLLHEAGVLVAGPAHTDCAVQGEHVLISTTSSKHSPSRKLLVPQSRCKQEFSDSAELLSFQWIDAPGLSPTSSSRLLKVEDISDDSSSNSSDN